MSARFAAKRVHAIPCAAVGRRGSCDSVKVSRASRPSLAWLGLILAIVVLASGCGSASPGPNGVPSVSSTLAPKSDYTTIASASPILSRVPACVRTQLTMKYYGGTVGAGNNFGTVAVLNHSGTACMWRGLVSVVPLTPDQQIMGDESKTAPKDIEMRATADGIALSAHDYVVNTQPTPGGDTWGEIHISGNARNDGNSPNGLCSRASQIRPAYWGIATLGHKFTVANYDRASAALSPNFFIGVTACHGIFNRLFVSASN